MDHATFVRPDLTTFCRLDELGLEAVGQRVEPDRAVIQCRVLEPDPWCRECGAEGVPRDTVIRRLAHEPFGHRPTTLMVRVRRYRCVTCRRTWRQDTSKAAAPRAKITRGGVGWALTGVVVDHLTVSRVAAGLGVSWHTANEAVIAEGKRVLIDDPARFAGVTTIGVDEHVWRHTRHGDKYVTVIIDLTPARNKSGPARRWTWSRAGRRPCSSSGWPIVLGRGGTGWRSSRWTGSPGSRPLPPKSYPPQYRSWIRSTSSVWQVRDWTGAGGRVQRHTLGHRGRAGDPLYRARRTLQTGADLLTDTQRARLDTVFAADEHVQVEATWGIYQRMVAAYREPNKTTGKQRMRAVIESVASGVPDALVEIRTLGRTLKRRAADVLAFFDRPGTSNGPTEAINGRLEHLRGSALGFRNLTHYIARSLLEAGGFRPPTTPSTAMSPFGDGERPLGGRIPGLRASREPRAVDGHVRELLGDEVPVRGDDDEDEDATDRQHQEFGAHGALTPAPAGRSEARRCALSSQIQQSPGSSDDDPISAVVPTCGFTPFRFLKSQLSPAYQVP